MKENCYASTQDGDLVGTVKNGLRYFKGIPYAKPPIGDLRFRAPQKPEPWVGTLDATQASAAAPQGQGITPLDNGMNEDCLYLNIASPQTDNKKRPVMFWIHGGAYTSGSGDQALYLESPLPNQGDTVLVTINYRLGALGFIDFRAVAENEVEVESNLGLRDMIAALEWTKNNISNFGGDPDNITIFGTSAGGMSVSMLMASPLANGLFHKAIAQSGGTHLTLLEKDAQLVAEAFIKESKVNTFRELLDLPSERILEIQQSINTIKFDNAGRDKHLPLSSFAFVPVIGDDVLPIEPIQAIRDGSAKDIPLIAGTALDEWMFFIQFQDANKNTLNHEALKKVCRSRIPGYSDEAVDTYIKALPEGTSATDLFCAIETDRFFRVPVIRLLEAQSSHQSNTFAYLFTQETHFLDGKLKSCHSIEIPYVFGNIDDNFAKMFINNTEENSKLADICSEAWLSFARSGEPKHQDIENWSSYSVNKESTELKAERNRSTMILGKKCYLHDDPMPDEREFWAELL